MVEGLDSVVRLGAGIAVWTASCLCKFAHFATVGAQGTALVFPVVERALLLVMPVIFGAGLGFEDPEVEELDAVGVGASRRAIRHRC